MTQEYTHGEPHLFSRPDRLDEPLHIVTTIFNPMRYRTRLKLYQDFVRMVEASGAILWTVEVATGDREFSITMPDNPHHLQLRTDTIAWHKERALNLMIERLPFNWKYACWMDSDVSFARGDFADEIKHALQIYDFVQPFSQSVDLGPNYEILNTFRSFAWSYHNDIPIEWGSYYGKKNSKHKNYWHPGYSLAFTHDAFDAVGGLMDFFVLGGADLFMLRALADIDRQLPESIGLSGISSYKAWKARADDLIKHNIGYVDGLLLHHFHGAKKNRRYADRGSILIDAKFEPSQDLYPDYQGLWQINRHNTKLRDGIIKYFGARNEDDISV